LNLETGFSQQVLEDGLQMEDVSPVEGMPGTGLDFNRKAIGDWLVPALDTPRNECQHYYREMTCRFLGEAVVIRR
jgi:hypothetical protein